MIYISSEYIEEQTIDSIAVEPILNRHHRNTKILQHKRLSHVGKNTLQLKLTTLWPLNINQSGREPLNLENKL